MCVYTYVDKIHTHIFGRESARVGGEGSFPLKPQIHHASDAISNECMHVFGCHAPALFFARAIPYLSRLLPCACAMTCACCCRFHHGRHPHYYFYCSFWLR